MGGRLEVSAEKQKPSISLEEVRYTSRFAYTILREAIELGWRYDGDYWERGMKFVRMHAEIIGTFENEEYGVVDVKGKQVVGVGAFVGDTSIYDVMQSRSEVPKPKDPCSYVLPLMH